MRPFRITSLPKGLKVPAARSAISLRKCKAATLSPVTVSSVFPVEKVDGWDYNRFPFARQEGLESARHSGTPLDKFKINMSRGEGLQNAAGVATLPGEEIKRLESVRRPTIRTIVVFKVGVFMDFFCYTYCFCIYIIVFFYLFM